MKKREHLRREERVSSLKRKHYCISRTARHGVKDDEDDDDGGEFKAWRSCDPGHGGNHHHLFI